MLSELPTLDGVPADVAAEYETGDDGTFRLKLEGPAPAGYATALDLATANRKATGYHEGLSRFLKSAADLAGVDRVPDDDPLRPVRERITKFDGIDLSEVESMRTRIAEFDKKGVKKPDDIDALLDARMAKFEEDKLAPLTADLATEREARLTAQIAADKAELHSRLRPLLAKAGAVEGAMTILLDEGSKSFEWLNGKVTAKQGQYSPKNGADPLQVNEWLVAVRKSHDFAFEKSSGGDAGGDDELPIPAGAKVLRNPTPAQLGENMDAIADGSIVVRNTI